MLEKYQHRYQNLLTEEQTRRIFVIAGNDLPKIVRRYLQPLQKGDDLLTETHLYTGLTVYCVEEEMAVHLHDLIFRRLFPDTPELPPVKLMDSLAGCMAELLLWSAEQTKHEKEQVTKQRMTEI
jgi:glycerol-3-phosphate dehydrogenase